jgi:hypothetical protein
MNDIQTYMYEKAVQFLAEFMYNRDIYRAKESSSAEDFEHKLLEEMLNPKTKQYISCSVNKNKSLSINYYGGVHIRVYNTDLLSARIGFRFAPKIGTRTIFLGYEFTQEKGKRDDLYYIIQRILD